MIICSVRMSKKPRNNHPCRTHKKCRVVGEMRQTTTCVKVKYHFFGFKGESASCGELGRKTRFHFLLAVSLALGLLVVVYCFLGSFVVIGGWSLDSMMHRFGLMVALWSLVLARHDDHGVLRTTGKSCLQIIKRSL